MAYKITGDCINCAACDSTCPVDCIREEGDAREIDEAACTDCGACVDSCPGGAIVPA